MKNSHPLEKFQYCPACGSPHFRVHDDRSKRCAQCGFHFYLNASASTAAVILNSRREMLVVRRAKEPARGTLDLPGGFCDFRETAEEGIMREVREETGLSVRPVRFLFSLPNIYPFGGMDIHTTDLFFLCQVEERGEAHGMDDASEAFWMPLDQVKPADFGLHSISRGVEKLLRDRLAMGIDGCQ